VQILVPMSFALYNTGDHTAAARRIDDVVANATQLGQPDLLSQALSMQTLVQFWLGNGLAEESLRRALELDDRRATVSVVYQPSMHNAILLSCTGRLDEAHDEFSWVRRQCIERGAESDQNFVAFHAVLNEIWRGDFAGATLLAEDAMERALHVGGLHRAAALIMRAHCAAYAGREQEARDDAGEALATVPRSESIVLTGWPITILGFLEVSLGNYDAALRALQPVLSTIIQAPQATEIYVAACLPDAVEAMIALDRLTDAEPLIDALERNGRRLDRAWMLAVGARCRAMLLAANGDVERACLTAQRAMTEHARLPMPFERARTQLLLGQLQRRQREKDISAATLRQALEVFEELDTPLWADRTRAELSRVKVGPRKTTLLTPSEQRVAELAASGMTTRDVAARLFVSPKTVEVNITRVYRKLGIRSRAELGRIMSQSNQTDASNTRLDRGGADA
jgi:DNA-binding CsgD family transcriptional regulator/tetratricopeptide (TPR) repeat protein